MQVDTDPLTVTIPAGTLVAGETYNLSDFPAVTEEDSNDPVAKAGPGGFPVPLDDADGESLTAFTMEADVAIVNVNDDLPSDPHVLDDPTDEVPAEPGNTLAETLADLKARAMDLIANHPGAAEAIAGVELSRNIGGPGPADVVGLVTVGDGGWVDGLFNVTGIGDFGGFAINTRGTATLAQVYGLLHDLLPAARVARNDDASTVAITLKDTTVSSAAYLYRAVHALLAYRVGIQ